MCRYKTDCRHVLSSSCDGHALNVSFNGISWANVREFEMLVRPKYALKGSRWKIKFHLVAMELNLM